MKTKNDTKLIFLDFDGVCNSYEEGSYHTSKGDEYGPSKTICERLKKFCERTNSKIIISSNWRKFEENGYYVFEKERVYNPLHKLKDILGDYIVGTLPKIRHVLKSEALILWIEENDFDYKNSKWVILDDDCREGFSTTHDYDIKDHYIETKSEFGITEEIISKMEQLIS